MCLKPGSKLTLKLTSQKIHSNAGKVLSKVNLISSVLFRNLAHSSSPQNIGNVLHQLTARKAAPGSFILNLKVMFSNENTYMFLDRNFKQMTWSNFIL